MQAALDLFLSNKPLHPDEPPTGNRQTLESIFAHRRHGSRVTHTREERAKVKEHKREKKASQLICTYCAEMQDLIAFAFPPSSISITLSWHDAADQAFEFVRAKAACWQAS